MISAILAYAATNLMEFRAFKNSKKSKKRITQITILSIILNVLIWLLLKGSPFWIVGSIVIHKIIPAFPVLHPLPFAAALGMGYYTAQIIGYILDCYWGISRPQKNPVKLFLFVGFFPQLTVGPISKYSELQCLYEEHSFSYENIAHGVQRILWGLFKKLVISDRIAIIVMGIWADTLIYNGIWPWIAVFLYPLEIYTDFSGCMDIVLGASELFDIRLPENFRNPFYALNSQEFWQRWHITLGAWAKDYIYYPVLRSTPIQAIGKWSKKHFKKRTAKLIPWIVGMGVLWFVMGFWHGSNRHIIGVSVWYWAILVLGEILSPTFHKLTILLKINIESFSWKLFLRIRTYFLYAIGAVLFSADSLRGAFWHIRILVYSLQLKNWNPWIFFDGSILKLGVTHKDLNVIFISLFVLLIIDALREKYGYARTWIDRQNLVFRWILYIVLFFAVIILGLYGPDYNASQFIYGQF